MSVLLQLKLLGLSLLVLVEIAASVAYVNHVVRFKSGIDKNETLRRIWSKPEQVIFQPVLLPILLSWVVGLGVNSLVRGMMIGFLQLIDALRVAGNLSLAGDFAVTVSGTAAGTIAGALIYIIDGGDKFIYQVAGMVITSLGISLLRIVGHVPGSAIAIWVVTIICIVIGVSVWIKTRGILPRVMTSSVRDLRSFAMDMSVPASTRMRFWLLAVISTLMVSALRVVDFFIVRYIERNEYTEIYLAQMLRNFGGLMVLIACSFYSIMITNVNLNIRLFVWQWTSVLLPIAVLGVVEILLTVLGPGANDWRACLGALRTTFMYGATGFLGSAVYLGVLARAASKALDPGIEGQSELIVDDDEDSDFDYEIDDR